MPKIQTHFQGGVHGFFPLPLQKMTLPLALVALISAFGSSFQYGYNVSVINSPAPVSGEQSKADVTRGVCGHGLVLF